MPDLLFTIWDFFESRWPRDAASRKTKMIRVKETKATTNEYDIQENNKIKWLNDGSPEHEENVEVNEVDNEKETLKTTRNEKSSLDIIST